MLSKPAFAKQIRQALENVHDSAYLQNLPLATELSRSGQTFDQSVRLLRAEVLAAIDSLRPGATISPRSREARPYTLMYGRYVQGMTTAELVDELAISVRQLRREHKRALEALTGLLWDRLSVQFLAARSQQDEGRRGTAEAETDQLISHSRAEDLDLSELINTVLATLAPVAGRRDITLGISLPGDWAPVHADRIVLRQALFELVAHALGRPNVQRVALAGSAGPELGLDIVATGAPAGNSPPAPSAPVNLDISRQLLASLGGRMTITEEPETWHASVRLPQAVHVPLLVMDDNASLVELFRRYLAGRCYRVIEARTAEQALQEARQANLGLIILDVMMPEQDGWEILQYLRSSPDTAQIPVLICSVLNEPEIAFALGASDYLPKPITQDALLAKVERWCSVLPAPVARSTAAPGDSVESPSA